MSRVTESRRLTFATVTQANDRLPSGRDARLAPEGSRLEDGFVQGLESRDVERENGGDVRDVVQNVRPRVLENVTILRLLCRPLPPLQHATNEPESFG